MAVRRNSGGKDASSVQSFDRHQARRRALFLASPMASGITGTVLFVDAGFHVMGV